MDYNLDSKLGRIKGRRRARSFDFDGSVSGTGDNIKIFASVENNGEQNDVNRSVTFTITGGDTHTITQPGPAGDAEP